MQIFKYMKNLKALILLIAVVGFAASCKKHVIAFDAEPLASDAAQVQIHYFAPVVAGAANNITRVDLNNKMIVDSTSTLGTYNAIPSGGVGRFFVTSSGNVNIKFYRGTSRAPVLVYDQNATLQVGKQNVFVYDFTKPPIVIDNGFPYPSVITDSTAKSSWVRFYNFLFESGNTPTTLKLQYQYQYNMDPGVGRTNQKSDWINLGSPVSFGEATGWIEVPVIKNIIDKPIDAGTERIDYRIRVIGANGADLGPLQVRNGSGVMVDYSDWWNATIGRAIHHILAGYRAATPIASVRTFSAR